MRTSGEGIRYLVAIALALADALSGEQAFSQAREAALTPAKEEILAGAKKEGKLILSPGYDQATIPHLVKAFTKRYPFIEVSWNSVTGVTAAQRQLFEVEAPGPVPKSTSQLGQYFSLALRKNLSSAISDGSSL